MPFATLLIILVIVLFIYHAWYNSAMQKGKRGEKRIFSILSKLPNEYIILNDLVFKTDKGTTQIDHVVVSKYGIFAIETKNYRGEIYGDDNHQEWTQIIVTDVTYIKKWWKTYTYVTKNHFYNPVKQSVGHALRIKEMLSAFPYVNIVPIVVFTGGTIMKAVKSCNYVINENHLLDVINKYKTTCLSNDDVESIIKILKENDVRETVSDKEHVKNLRTAAKVVNATIKSGICPKCGGLLIKRKGEFGTFYGCSNYPKCKFTVK